MPILDRHGTRKLGTDCWGKRIIISERSVTDESGKKSYARQSYGKVYIVGEKGLVTKIGEVEERRN